MPTLPLGAAGIDLELKEMGLEAAAKPFLTAVMPNSALLHRDRGRMVALG